MDLDTMLDEAAPARHARLDGPDSPAAASLYRRIITQPPAAATARRRFRYRFAVPAIAGTCAVAAAAAVSLAGGAPAPQHGTAAGVLGRAALTAARQPAGAVPGPGQYVYAETIEGQRTKAPGRTASGICRQTVRVWAAPDGSGRMVASAPAGASCDGGGIPSQTFPKGQEIDYNVYPGAAGLPADPTALEQFIVRHFEYPPGHSGPEDIAATFDFAGTFLQSGAPPDIRAALYRLIQKLPGIELLGPVTDRLGRHGVGVGFTQYGVRDVLIFNPVTSAVLEREGIAVDPAQIPVPPGWARYGTGEVINYTVYIASGVVNSAPQGD
jgi:hypothetical protein